MHYPYYVLAGGYDTKNVGDYAMLAFLHQLLEPRRINIKILSRHHHNHLVNIYQVAELIDNFEYNTRSESQGRFFRGFNYGDSNDHLYNLRRELQGSEGLIIGGGRLLIDQTLDVMRGPLPYFATLVTLCRFLGVPVYIYAMTIVANKTPEGQKWLKYVIDNAASVAVRDQDSVEVLKKAGCNQESVVAIADPAYGLNWQPKPKDELHRCMRAGLTVRAISERWGGISEDSYLSKMARVVGHLQSRGFEVIGIPQQYYGVDDPSYDDRNILKKVSALVPFEVIGHEMLDLREYEDLYRSLGLLVGIRRHSFIFAALSGVPVFPFSENANATRACAELGIPEPLGLDAAVEQCTSRLNDFLMRRESRRCAQDEALRRLTMNLQSQYEQWLLGKMWRNSFADQREET